MCYLHSLQIHIEKPDSCKSSKSIVKRYPEWKFKIIGTEKAGQKILTSTYAKNLISDFESLGKNTEYLGFISNEEVSNILKKT